MKRPAYPKYKPSGIEWLGDVPEHWNVKRGRFCQRVNPLRGLEPDDEVSFVPMEAVGEYGGLDLQRTVQLAEVGGGYTEFEDGDVVVAKITPCFENGKGALASGLLNGVAFGTTELHVLRAFPNLERRFLFYLSISSVYRKTGEAEMYGAGGQKRVPPDFCKDFRTPLPPLPEQLAIAAYLDHETAKIDALVAKKRELIEKLKEKRAALISRTVTRGLPPDAARAAGLGPNCKLKPSGVDWLGEVPEHWKVKELRYLTQCLDGKRVPLSGEERSDRRGEYPYWGANGVVDSIDAWLFDEPLVLLGEDGAPFFQANKTVAFYVTGKIWVNNHAHVLRPNRGTQPEFLAHALNQTQYGAFIEGSTRDKLTQADMNCIPIPCPPFPEQEAIVKYLNQETLKLDTLLSKVQSAICQLQEFRTALITAAVTGKIDVREARA